MVGYRHREGKWNKEYNYNSMLHWKMKLSMLGGDSKQNKTKKPPHTKKPALNKSKTPHCWYSNYLLVWNIWKCSWVLHEQGQLRSWKNRQPGKDRHVVSQTRVPSAQKLKPKVQCHVHSASLPEPLIFLSTSSLQYKEHLLL